MTLLTTNPTEIAALAQLLTGIHPQAHVLLETTPAFIKVEADGVEVGRLSRFDTEHKASMAARAFERGNALALNHAH